MAHSESDPAHVLTGLSSLNTSRHPDPLPGTKNESVKFWSDGPNQACAASSLCRRSTGAPAHSDTDTDPHTHTQMEDPVDLKPLLAKLKEQGAFFSMRAGQIHLTAPNGLVTADMLQTISNNLDQLLTLMEFAAVLKQESDSAQHASFMLGISLTHLDYQAPHSWERLPTNIRLLQQAVTPLDTLLEFLDESLPEFQALFASIDGFCDWLEWPHTRTADGQLVPPRIELEELAPISSR